MKTEKIVKGYATTCSGKWCNLKYDYSPVSFHECNNCLFCYKNISGGKVRHRVAKIASSNEVHFNELLFKMPITVSRFCDPLASGFTTKESISFSEYILENGGMISFISPSSDVPEKIFEIAEKYGERFQYQIHVFSDDSFHGKTCREVFAPKFCNLSDHKDNIDRFNKIGTKVIVKIEPIIIGINDTLIDNILNYFKNIGCYNFIFRQLYSTPMLKEKISLISKRYASLLSELTGRYYTYSGEVIFDALSTVLLTHTDCTITFCQNSWMNKILKSHKNCCQFDSCDYIFNENFNYIDKVNKNSTEARLINVSSE